VLRPISTLPTFIGDHSLTGAHRKDGATARVPENQLRPDGDDRHLSRRADGSVQHDYRG
jgi:hypothetical protein